MGFLSKSLSALENSAGSPAPPGGAEPRAVSEFERIVNEVAASTFRIARASYSGDGNITVSIRSGSGRSTWPASFHFDEQTGDFTCHGPYATSSSALYWFGEKVRDRIRSSRASLPAPPAPGARRFPRASSRGCSGRDATPGSCACLRSASDVSHLGIPIAKFEISTAPYAFAAGIRVRSVASRQSTRMDRCLQPGQAHERERGRRT
jgi:hypothetical protein